MFTVKRNKYEDITVGVRFLVQKSQWSDFFSCEVQFVEIRTQNDSLDDKPITYIREGDKLFTITYQTQPMERTDDKATTLHPAFDNPTYCDKRYVQWYSGRVQMNNCDMHSFEDESKMIACILKKITTTKEKYNLGYKYPDSLKCLIETLTMLKVDQLVYHRNTHYTSEFSTQSYLDYTIW